MEFVTAYGPKTKVTLDCSVDGAGRTKQSFKEECDINNIMSRFIKTGVLDFTQRNQPRYGDCTGLEFQTCMDIVAKARTMFAEMPAALRGRFDNEPAKFLDFINDDKNREEARELGLLRPESVAPTAPATATADAPQVAATTAPATPAAA